jgi:hypothetical protein
MDNQTSEYVSRRFEDITTENLGRLVRIVHNAYEDAVTMQIDRGTQGLPANEEWRIAILTLQSILARIKEAR